MTTPTRPLPLMQARRARCISPTPTPTAASQAETGVEFQSSIRPIKISKKNQQKKKITMKKLILTLSLITLTAIAQTTPTGTLTLNSPSHLHSPSQDIYTYPKITLDKLEDTIKTAKSQKPGNGEVFHSQSVLYDIKTDTYTIIVIYRQ